MLAPHPCLCAVLQHRGFIEHPQQAHLEAALRRDAVETVLVEAEALACVQLIILLDLFLFCTSDL